jgi:hypothetical protein
MAEEDPRLGFLISDPISGFSGTCEQVGNSFGKKDIVLDGFFQDYKIYTEHKEKIRQWFRFKKLSSQPEDKLIIHVRLGDYLTTPDHHHMIVPINFYHRLIEIDKPSTVCFVTDSPNHPCLKQFNAEIVSTDTLHDFAFLASANRLCISNSTFSWWAAWLSDAERIYYPDIGDAHFNKLWVYDEDRYIRINV